jgi:hypothetical protein
MLLCPINFEKESIMTKGTEVSIIEHPYYKDVLEKVVRVVKTDKNGKMSMSYKGGKAEVLHNPSVGFYTWVYPEKVRR